VALHRGECATREERDKDGDECWVVFEGRLVASRAKRKGEESVRGGGVGGGGDTSSSSSVVVAELGVGATFGNGGGCTAVEFI
jgi:hypothetical protein